MRKFPSGVELTKSGRLLVRLSDREWRMAIEIQGHRNKLNRKYKVERLNISATTVAIAFAKALGELFAFIAKELYTKGSQVMPDDPHYRWFARHERTPVKNRVAFHIGGSILMYTDLPVALGIVTRENPTKVVFENYLPAPWSCEGAEFFKSKPMFPRSDLRPITELLDALQTREKSS